ncbi:unnamed protein product [Adineta ricciae]|uniref:G-protein coupled receptors family 1 profile domain-containing protein n=1 Tax=Adineta ricciae TaxID=249248 RepID=A0A813X665_ADIRI|nr:unnamed protein product [Adineta ricciae]CAF1430895.1 unnamed protein product [Adineta ricciae]
MTSSVENNISSSSEDKFVEPLRFWIFLLLDIPAIACSIFALYHIFKQRKLRESLYNHTIILILSFNTVYQLIDIPLHIQYFRTGAVRPTSTAICLIWWFIDYGFFFIDLVLLMWTSFERHLLIFHKSLVDNRGKRLLVHYLPLFVLVISMLCFYIIVIFAPPCHNTFNFSQNYCGTPGCYHSIPILAMIERIGFAIVPTFLITILSVALFARIIWQKHRVQRNVEWRKQRKITINTILMSSTYLCFDLPLSIIDIVHLSGSTDWANDALPALYYLSYFPIMLLPFVCLGSIPELRNKIKILNLQQRTHITPTVAHT